MCMDEYRGRFSKDGVVRDAKDVYVDCIDDHWVRVGDGVAWSTYSGVFKVEDGVLLSKAFGCFEYRPYAYGEWETARKAYAYLFPTPAQQPATDLQWQRRVDPEQVDIPRYLQEAHDAGALEVTITVGDKSMTYVHESMADRCDTYLKAMKKPILANFILAASPSRGLPFVEGWYRRWEPLLSEVKAWEAEQERIAEARKVDVKIVGVR